jgi:hypothetical protein
MKRFSTKQRIVAAVASVAMVAAGAGAAFAYFTTTGSGTGSGSVGATSTASDWGVTFPGPNTYSGGASAIFPGVTESIPVTITNNAKGNELLSSVTVVKKTAANSSNASETDIADSSGNPINGCLASWWTVTVSNTGTNFNADIAPAGHDSETVSLTLNDDSTHNQGACESASPAFTVSAG